MTDQKTGSYEDFKAHTRALVRGERQVEPGEPKIWILNTAGQDQPVRFRSMEAGAKLLSVQNRRLLRVIAERKPESVTELATMTGRAEQNVMRTLVKFREAGIVRLERGKGRAFRPVVTARKVRFEIDLLDAEPEPEHQRQEQD